MSGTKANKLENFEIEVVHRCLIKGADYNPRKITKEAEKNLRAFLKKHGLWSPLVWNRRTGTLVAGHRRLEWMDTAMQTDDYELTMAVVDEDERTEVKGNVFMNNASAQGEWDYEILTELKSLFPDLDYEKELGFTAEEVELFIVDEEEPDFSELENIDRDALLVIAPQKDEVTEEERDAFREAKKKARETAKEDNADGRGYSYADADYTLKVIFTSASEKREFLEALDLDVNAKRIFSKQLMEAI